jgi:hypothetical protein
MIPASSVAFALAGSVVITAILTIAFILLLNKAKGKGWKLSLLEAIKFKDEFPSLPNLQFFMWSVVIAFAFLTVYLIRSQVESLSRLPVYFPRIY